MRQEADYLPPSAVGIPFKKKKKKKKAGTQHHLGSGGGVQGMKFQPITQIEICHNLLILLQ